jgi:flagellar protein FlgJ
MRQLSGTVPTAPTAATVSNISPSRPVAAAGAFGTFSAIGQGGNFAAAFASIEHDVAAYIAKGDGGFPRAADAAAASQALTPQALALALANRGRGALDAAGDGADGDQQQQFLASIKPWAEQAGARLGVSPDLVAAHAALESGWGRQPLRSASAGDTNNLFGLKAGGNWRGAIAAASTTEYTHGAMLRKTEQFRSYPDAASAFRDYADMLTSNPRYQAALNTGSDARAFAHGLAQGGYATDPDYADKLSKVAAQLQRRSAGVTPTAD